jgi:hypothetical protein
MGSAVGAVKTAAARIGLSVDVYLQRIASGGKRCFACEQWKDMGEFSLDRHRGDGRSATCRACRTKQYRERYVPRPRPQHRPCYSQGGNPQSARVRIYQRIKRGELPHPNTLPCSDCGLVWCEGQKRHEYDHPNGYAGAYALTVEPVCTRCHNRRGRERGTHSRKHGSDGRFIG